MDHIAFLMKWQSRFTPRRAYTITKALEDIAMRLEEYSGKELSLLAVMIAMALSDDMNAKELGALGSFLSTITSNIFLIASTMDNAPLEEAAGTPTADESLLL